MNLQVLYRTTDLQSIMLLETFYKTHLGIPLRITFSPSPLEATVRFELTNTSFADWRLRPDLTTLPYNKIIGDI